MRNFWEILDLVQSKKISLDFCTTLDNFSNNMLGVQLVIGYSDWIIYL